ncbi:hypothetical protein IQ235_14695 [Oscillatoriales cyanobacterium LEGE 11467]|uniref:Uncharacterized protein n=1 Tax=Zarconia navalis LEGE 11467 TaxID=1828826 RepID=A0A928ZAV4_9CYAN|nr:hypothetical protein [Zarconia navalis]MBE9042026.1 hypothetical protein [Zarconia navalis LEGE 11467]
MSDRTEFAVRCIEIEVHTDSCSIGVTSKFDVERSKVWLEIVLDRLLLAFGSTLELARDIWLKFRQMAEAGKF